MSTRVLPLVALFIALLAGRAYAQIITTDTAGRINGITLQGEPLPVRTDLRVCLRGWGRNPGLSESAEVKMTREDGRTTWRGSIEALPGKRYRFEETLEQANGVATLGLKVTAEAEIDTEGIFFWLDVPMDPFAGGRCELGEAGAPVETATLPVERPQSRHFARGTVSRVAFADPRSRLHLEMAFDRALPVVVQDTREWRGTDYSTFCQIAPHLAAGESAALKVSLKLAGEPDRTPAKLSLDAKTARYRLDGIGGDYCFGIESPVTQYTLKNLNVGWARTEMTLSEWEPENDNDSPAQTRWDVLEAHDKPDSNLRREFLLAQQIQRMGIPSVISIWILPEWMYAEPGKGPQAGRRKIPAEKWPEVLESIGSYLLYAKRKYGVEPDLFSFNESDIGVRVLFTPEEHRDQIKRVGAYLQGLGLKTKMLLGDTGNARGTHTYCLPTAGDPEAMRYVGAVAFHSWGGGSAADYQAWSNLARRLKRPLLVTELGVDAGAWRTRSYGTFDYAMREVRMYQELLLHARPQGTMQWEFTEDYSIVHTERDAAGQVRITPTVRFYVVKHFCNLTPRRADALATGSDNPSVLFTAFSGKVRGRSVLTLHLANLGAAREALLTGIPSGVRRLRAIRTSETEEFKELPPVPVQGGSVKLPLEQQSLLTLTTMP